MGEPFMQASFMASFRGKGCFEISFFLTTFSLETRERGRGAAREFELQLPLGFSLSPQVRF